jgi:hypothetical protein
MIRVSTNGKPTAQSFFVSNGEHVRTIHLQSFDRGSSSRREANKPYSIPTELCLPNVMARVKDGNLHSSLRIDRHLPCSFAKRAGHTGQGEVIQRGWTACRLGNNVVHVKGGFLGELGQEAILAGIFGTLNNGLPQEFRDNHAVMPRVCPIARSADAAKTASRLTRPSLPPRGVRYPSAAVLSLACQAVHGDGALHLSADETAQGRRGTRFRIESSETYARFPTQEEVAPSKHKTQANL